MSGKGKQKARGDETGELDLKTNSSAVKTAGKQKAGRHSKNI